MQRLFHPQSVAVIGGGPWCANVLRQLARIGYPGAIWQVHPSRGFTTVADLPAPPDAAFIGVNRAATVGVVRDLAARGAGGAICFASGFAEAQAELGDGAAVQADLVAAAGAMPILGPNCYGYVNALDGVALWPDQHGMSRVDRGVAIVTQSSNIAINLTMQRRGLPLAFVVTAGNQAQTGLAQIGAALLDDPRVTALGLHVEGIGDVTALTALAERARRLGKPVVALTVGASDQARSAAVSHTASMTGAATAVRALLARLGMAQVDSLAVMLELLKLWHVAGPLPSRRIASMSCSGGEAGLMADAGLAAGVSFPPLGAAQRDALRAVLGPRVALSNPLDYHTYVWNDRAAMAGCFQAMMTPDLALGCVVLDFPRADLCTGVEWQAVVDAVATVNAPMAILSSLPENMPEAVAQDCIARGIVPLCGLPEGLAAIAAAHLPVPAPTDPWPAPPPRPAGVTLTEGAAKDALARHGLRIPRGARGSDPVQRAAAIGFPVVLKAEGLAHKTEAGGVALSLASPEAVAEAAARMGAGSYLVEEMLTGAVAELLIGVTRDPCGWLLTLGAGGVRAEVWRDTVSLLLPVTEADIRAALTRLRIAPLLAGWRGAPGADTAGIVRAVMAVQDHIAAHPDVLEIEINPLICRAGDAVAADALIRKEAP